MRRGKKWIGAILICGILATSTAAPVLAEEVWAPETVSAEAAAEPDETTAKAQEAVTEPEEEPGIAVLAALPEEAEAGSEETSGQEDPAASVPMMMAVKASDSASGQDTTGWQGFHQDADGSWVYYKNGAVSLSNTVVSGTVNGTEGWWYIDGNGKADLSYTGFAVNSSASWYVVNGLVDFSVAGVYKDKTGALGEKGAWYYVVGNKVKSDYTGVANHKNENGWWYVQNGKVDFTATTVAQNKNGWWYVLNGRVETGYNGFATNKSGQWYVENGQVDFSVSGVYKDTTGVLGEKGAWYYVSGNKVKTSFNGLGANSNGMWVIENGKVNFDYNGSYTYNGVTYSVSDGRASLSYGVSDSMYRKAQTQSSSTKWLVMVDVSNCKVGIFYGSKGNWVAKKYWDCTTGKSSTPTCIGTYTIYDKGKSFGTDTYTCWYYNRFNGAYMLHSVLCYPGTKTISDGRLGMHLSHGCVRVAFDNAKWVYDNIPYGTRVVTY